MILKYLKKYKYINSIPGTGVVVADGLDHGGQHACHNSKNAWHSHYRDSPLDCKENAFLMQIGTNVKN